jgi:hypothetical protein
VTDAPGPDVAEDEDGPEEPREPRMLCARRYTECCGDVYHCGLPAFHSGPHIAMMTFEDSDCTPWPTEAPGDDHEETMREGLEHARQEAAGPGPYVVPPVWLRENGLL